MIETFTDHGQEYFFANTPEENEQLLALAKRLEIAIRDKDTDGFHELCFTGHGHEGLGTWKPFACLVVKEGRAGVEEIRKGATRI